MMNRSVRVPEYRFRRSSRSKPPVDRRACGVCFLMRDGKCLLWKVEVDLMHTAYDHPGWRRRSARFCGHHLTTVYVAVVVLGFLFYGVAKVIG